MSGTAQIEQRMEEITCYANSPQKEGDMNLKTYYRAVGAVKHLMSDRETAGVRQCSTVRIINRVAGEQLALALHWATRLQFAHRCVGTGLSAVPMQSGLGHNPCSAVDGEIVPCCRHGKVS